MSVTPVEQKRLLVIGCGRSGTQWLSELMKDHGLDIGHEHMGNDGVVGWQWAAPRRWHNHGWRLDYRFDHIWHLVRHPLGAIASMTTHQRRTLSWMEDVLDVGGSISRIGRCARLWVLWNRFCAQQAERTVHIERAACCGGTYEDICRWLGLRERELVRHRGYSRNSRPHRELTWDQLATEASEWALRVRADAAHYGYGDDE